MGGSATKYCLAGYLKRIVKRTLLEIKGGYMVFDPGGTCLRRKERWETLSSEALITRS